MWPMFPLLAMGLVLAWGDAFPHQYAAQAGVSQARGDAAAQEGGGPRPPVPAVGPAPAFLGLGAPS